MAHRTSAPALRAARAISEHYIFTPKDETELTSGRIPTLTGSEAHVATIIDYATNVFQVANLRTELGYWIERMICGTATAPQIGAFLQKVDDAFGMIPKFTENEERAIVSINTPPQWGQPKPENMTLSKSSLEGARYLFHYYKIAARDGIVDVKFDRLAIAKLIEVSLGLVRALEVWPKVQHWKARLREGQAAPTDIRKLFRFMSVLLEYLPNYEDRREEAKLLV